MSKESFVFYTRYREALLSLPEVDRGAILMGCIDYVASGLEYVPRFNNPAAGMLFGLIRQDIDADKKRYEERCAKNRANASGRNRSQANASERRQSQTMAADKDKDKDKDIYKGIYTRTRAKTKFSNFEERDPAETIARIGGTL